MDYLAQGKIVRAADLYHAAMIFQHGNCPEHYQLTMELAERAMQQGYRPARWLYAAASDRYLVALGKPQKFGTQYRVDDQGWHLYPVDPAVTDAERQKYDAPPLAEAQKLADEMNKKP